MTAMKKEMSTFLERGALQQPWLKSWEHLSPLGAGNSWSGRNTTKDANSLNRQAG